MKPVKSTLLRPLQERFQALPPRDQRAVMLLGMILGALFVWAGLWQPIERNRAMNLAAFQKFSADLGWMQSRAALVRAAPAAVAATARDGGTLLATATDTAALYQLTISHAEPADDGSLRLSMDNAAFAKILSWLEVLQREHQMTTADVTVERRGNAPGFVSVALTLRGAR